MENRTLKKALTFCILLVMFITVPNINVIAETNKNFSVKVETNKLEYSTEEEVTYKIIVKNISDKDINDVIISDALPKDIVIIETDGNIDGKVITWKKIN